MARNIYHRKDGRFEGRYANGYDSKGKTKYSSVFGKTYAETKEKLERAKVAVPLAHHSIKHSPMANPQTVIEAVATHLDASRLRLKPSTLGVYKRYLDIYIAPHFGKTRCKAMTTELSQDFVNKLLENGLSVVTVQSVFNLMKTSIETANGSVLAVKFPKQTKKQVEFLSTDEQKRLEEAAKKRGADNYIAIMLCLYTGIRIGEVCGLRWADINLECGLLYVNRTMQRIRSNANSESKTEIAFLAPKSATSTREIPLPDFMTEILREFRHFAKTDYVVNYKSKPIEPRTLQYRFKRILEAAEVKDVCWHTTRHTFATRALENGFDVKSLSEILGHGSATVTLNKYAHSSTEHKRGCMNALSAVYSTTLIWSNFWSAGGQKLNVPGSREPRLAIGHSSAVFYFPPEQDSPLANRARNKFPAPVQNGRNTCGARAWILTWSAAANMKTRMRRTLCSAIFIRRSRRTIPLNW